MHIFAMATFAAPALGRAKPKNLSDRLTLRDSPKKVALYAPPRTRLRIDWQSTVGPLA
jgi:hypothetical protein